MIDWKRQGDAVIGSLSLAGGDAAQVVIVGPRSNSNGVAIVRSKGDAIETTPLRSMIDDVGPGDFIEMLCMQERLHGAAALPAATF